MIQLLRSMAFIMQMYVAMLIISVAYFPWAVISAAGAHAACHAYCRWVIWTLGWMTGLRCEVRGTPPTDDVMIAAKHQSFLDILMIYNAVPRGKFIMKRELLFAPFVGQYGLRIGCVPVNRGKRGAAIAKMLSDVKTGKRQGGQLIIYPPRHPRAPRRAAPLQGWYRRALRTIGPAMRAGRGQCRRLLATPQPVAQTGSGRGRVPPKDRPRHAARRVHAQTRR